MEIKGYLIQDQKGDYLSQTYFWFSHENPRSAWVHPEGDLVKILNQSHGWKSKPSRITKATYSPKNGIRVVGEPDEIKN